jgi:hypothetical protein
MGIPWSMTQFHLNPFFFFISISLVYTVGLGESGPSGTGEQGARGHDNRLYYSTEQMAGRAAFAIHREFVTNVILPNFALVNALVYFAELGFATRSSLSPNRRL